MVLRCTKISKSDFLSVSDTMNRKIPGQIHVSQIIRNLASKVKRSDRAVILEQFKTIYRAENLEMAVQALEDFIAE